MPRRDFVLRLIEQMGRVLARLRARILGGEADVVRGELRDVIAWSGLDLDMAERLDAGTLVSLLSLGGSLDVARCVLVADVLAVEALRQEALGVADAPAHLRAKAVALYHAARPLVAGGDADGIDRRIAELTEARPS